ncbi:MULTISPECIES: DUF2267 domain-containing protein [Streptomyces]|jgi:uncharacterized protein (DUF2267 family)|uniref:Uncharacterized protein (DUF2267 family) n=1 Tax=Streptomyces nymphaeiformis TaxID=2663842 RepID=A0A7W7TZE6_9ACTN|nr:DUF2267 domain-containing protein [Streptomyces nymphaeiformis]MBB4982209.1 uncharacterized protein (DUF2267 family) [Streptomyces nymphaeiformis]
MFDQPRPHRVQPAMTFEQMLDRVRHEGAHPTRERAEEAVHTVLASLGRQLVGDERVDLAQCLPVEAALTLTAQIPATERLTGWGFIRDMATRAETTPAIARWDTGAVLTVVARLAGPDLLARILQQLPAGYALLFGQAELRQPQPAA